VIGTFLRSSTLRVMTRPRLQRSDVSFRRVRTSLRCSRVDYRRATVEPGAARGSLPWRSASATQPRRLLPPVRPRVGADDSAAGAHHARAECRHRHVIWPAVRRSAPPDDGTASMTPRATARRCRACCPVSSAARPEIVVVCSCRGRIFAPAVPPQVPARRNGIAEAQHKPCPVLICQGGDATLPGVAPPPGGRPFSPGS
jgi:hypothetical protein